MDKIKDGDVVICGDGRVGTYIGEYGDNACVLISDGLIWYGPEHQLRFPQDSDDLESAANLVVDRFEGR